jgi:hypothetical protein
MTVFIINVANSVQLLPKASRIRPGMKIQEMFLGLFRAPQNIRFLGTFESYTALTTQNRYLIGASVK